MITNNYTNLVNNKLNIHPAKKGNDSVLSFKNSYLNNIHSKPALYYPQIYFLGTSDTTKVNLKDDQKLAKQNRKEMPSLMRFLYPIANRTYGMPFINNIHKDIDKNQLYNSTFKNITPEQEFDFLEKYSLIDKFSKDNDSMLNQELIDIFENLDDDELLSNIIRKFLKNDIPDIRITAAQAVRSIKNTEKRDSFLEELSNNKDEWIRRGAVIASEKMENSDKKYNFLKRMAKDKASYVRGDVINAAESINNPQQLYDILKIFSKDKSDHNQKVAAKTLEKIKDSKLLYSLAKEFLTDKNPEVRINAVISLRNIKDPILLHNAINEYIQDDLPEVRKYAASAAGNIDIPELRDNFFIYLSNRTDPYVKTGAAIAAERMEDSANKYKLIRKLAMEDYPETRKYAAKSAASIKNTDELYDILKIFLTDTDDSVKKYAINSARNLSKTKLLYDILTEFSKDQNKNVRYNAVKAAENIKDSKLLYRFIMKSLNDESADVREVAAKSANNLNDDRMICNVIKKLIKDENRVVKYKVLPLLKNINNFEFRDEFIQKLLKDENSKAISVELVRNIENNKLRDSKIIEFLDKENDIEIRSEAAKALGDISNYKLQCSTAKKLLEENDEKINLGLSDSLDHIKNNKLQKYLINELLKTNNMFIDANIASMAENINDYKLQSQVYKRLLQTKFGWVRTQAAKSMFKSAVPRMNEFTKEAPYLKVLESSIENLELKDILQPHDLLNSLYTLKLTGKDEGTLKAILDNYKKLYDKAVKNPFRFANEGKKNKLTQEDITRFFYKNGENILLSDILVGNDATQLMLFRKKHAFENYLSDIANISKNDEEFKLMQKVCEAKNISGKTKNIAAKAKDLSAKDKTDIITIYDAYHKLELDTGIFNKIAKSQEVDIESLRISLFNNILKTCGMTQKEIENIKPEVFNKWNTNYLHFIPKAITDFENKDLLKEIIKSFMQGKYKNYLYNKLTDIGQANRETIKQFKNENLSYSKWINYKPATSDNVLVSTKAGTEQFKYIKALFKEELGILAEKAGDRVYEDRSVLQRLSNISNFKNESLVINDDTLKSEKLFRKFILDVKEAIQPLWKDAYKNNDDSILAIRNHFNDRIRELDYLINNGTKVFPFEIKLWERNPGKDLFHGHYSTSCISLDGISKEATPDYLAHTAIQMIEFIDKEKQKVIGHSTCFMAKDKNNNPLMILNDIELTPGYQGSNDMRNEIVKFAKDYAKAVTKGKDIPIYLGTTYNDVIVSELPKEKIDIQFIGKALDDKLYLDAIKGWTKNLTELKSVTLHVLHK